MNESESLVREQLRRYGVKVLRNGWPDFLCVAKKSNSVFCVEVKAQGDRLSKEQLDVHDVLRLSGIPVFVVGSDGLLERQLPEVGGLTFYNMAQLCEVVKTVRDLYSRTLTMANGVERLLDELKRIEYGIGVLAEAAERQGLIEAIRGPACTGGE